MPDNSDDKTLTAGAVQMSFASVGPCRLIRLSRAGDFFYQRFLDQILQSGESV